MMYRLFLLKKHIKIQPTAVCPFYSVNQRASKSVKSPFSGSVNTSAEVASGEVTSTSKSLLLNTPSVVLKELTTVTVPSVRMPRPGVRPKRVFSTLTFVLFPFASTR